MLTAGKLAKSSGLSRTALLYYETIGLLCPSERSARNYRHYSEADVRRLQQICTLWEAGLRLVDIKRVLDLPQSALSKSLAARLEELNSEIERLRRQQRFILGLLKSKNAHARIRVMNRTIWTSLLQAAGFSDTDRAQWHAEFERQSPEKHQQFLEFLCIPDDEVEAIRARARAWLRSKANSKGERRCGRRD